MSKLSLRRAPGLALFLILIVLAPASGRAFTPDDAKLAARLHAAYAGLTSWKAVIEYPDHPGVATTILWSGGRWRQDWSGPATGAAVGSGFRVLASRPDRFPLSPLFVFMPERPVETWKAWGVDNATRQYGFCGDAPCFIIGADPTDETRPSVWLDNETLAPLRVRLGGDAPATVTFSDFAQRMGFALPGRGEATLGNGETLAFTIQWSELLKPVDPALLQPGSVGAIVPGQQLPEPFGSLLEWFHIPSR